MTISKPKKILLVVVYIPIAVFIIFSLSTSAWGWPGLKSLSFSQTLPPLPFPITKVNSSCPGYDFDPTCTHGIYEPRLDLLGVNLALNFITWTTVFLIVPGIFMWRRSHHKSKT